MTTFLVYWQRFGKIFGAVDELDNWHDCYEWFYGHKNKTQEQAIRYMHCIETEPEFGKIRRLKLYRLTLVETNKDHVGDINGQK